MKLYKGLILLFFSTILLGGCIPDTFTKWKVQDPTTGEGGEGGLPPGVTPPPDPNVSIPPTDIAYSPPSYPAERSEATYFFEQTSQTSTGELPTPLTCVALNGGEIREGDMSFFVSQVTTREGVVTGEQTLPTGMVLNPLTGEITGFAQVFTDGKFYTIQGDHIGGAQVNTTIQISIATKPESLYYPQADGLTLVLNVDRPENFKVGDLVTSNRGAKGTVTYSENERKILHVRVDCLTTPVDSCPIFMKDDLIDNTNGFFIEESKIEEEVTYAFENSSPINHMLPVVIPAVDGEEPQFSISPDIRQWGVNFNTDTGEITGFPQIGTCSAAPPPPQSPYTSPLECTDNSGVWTYQTTINLPVTLFNVTVKNILGETANVQFKLSSLDILAPQAINSIAYNYENEYRVALYVADIRGYSKGSYVSNQDATLGTVIGMDDIDEGDQSGSQSAGEPQPGSILVLIDSSSILKFVKDQFIDDTQKYVIPLTQITQEPELVFLLETNTSIPVTVEPTLSQDELNSLYWKSEPELTHLCNSIANPGTIFYRDENKSDCEDNNGFCDGKNIGNCPQIDPSPDTCMSLCTAAPAATWTTDGVWTNTNELYFNRRTGKFGASNPTKAFAPQKFDVTVIALDGSETKTDVTFGFQAAPEDLSYSNQAFLEVDKPDEFRVNDFISSLSGALGIVKSKEIITTDDPTPVDKEILIVKVMAGEFEQHSNVDNLRVYTYQKAIIDEIKYGQVGIQIDASATDFAVGEEIAVATNNVKGIVQYRQTDPIDVLWVRLIELDDTSTINQTFLTSNTIQGENNTASVLNVFGDVLNINHNAAVTFETGMDVSASPTEGFGMVNAVDNNSNSLVINHASGKILRGEDLYRLNPWNSTIGSNGNSLINLVGQVQTFYIDRHNELPIQPILNSPEDNGVTFSITPPLPSGLVLDETTGKISVPEGNPGPVASNLAYYTVVAKNLLGESATLFGLKVREVFAIEDVTGLGQDTGEGGELVSPNLTSALHKFGQGYNNFPCRVTSDQVYSGDTANAKRSKDIYCIYDIGEADLFYNGLKLKMNVGPDLCQYVEHVPTWFYQWQIKTSIPSDDPGPPAVTQNVNSVVIHSGDYMDILCAVAQPDDQRTQFPVGDPKETCLGNYTDEGGPDCDIGSIPTIERSYSVADACVNPENITPTNPFPGVNSYQECFDTTAECSDGTGTLNKEQCLTAPEGFTWNSEYAWVQEACYLVLSEDTRTDCENNYGNCEDEFGVNIPTAVNRAQCDIAGGAWTPDGVWTDNATCDSVGQIPGVNAECGGSQVNCIAGPAKDDENYPESFLTNRFNEPAAYGQVIAVGTQPIEFTYASPKSKNYQSNLYLSNYSWMNQCTPYGTTPASINDYEYNINDWTSVGGLFDPMDSGDPNVPNDGPSDFNPFAGGNTVYDYRCLDGARNVKARIRVLIREWDWNFKPSNTIDVMNLINPPWLDGALMDDPTGTDPQGFPANSFRDWDDQTNVGGVCNDPNINFPEGDL